MENELLFADEVYQIIGAVIEVHRERGSDFLESVHDKAMRIESRKRDIPFDSQAKLPV
jgi:GxxExxY protein